MDHSTELKLWFVQNIGRFDIQIERLTWLEQLMPGMVDVSVSLTLRGDKLFGLGFGEDEDLALTKALSEIFERVVLWDKRFKTSNGMAAHVSHELAFQSAVNEVRERDLFLCHFLSHTPFVKKRDDLVVEFGLQNLKDWFESRNVDFSLHPLGHSGFVAVLDGRRALLPFGFVFGAAVKNDPGAAALSASVEACRDGARILGGANKTGHEPLSLSDFLNLQAPNFSDHGRLALDLSYADSIRWLIEESSEHVFDNGDIEVSVSPMICGAPELDGVPLVFARASSPDLQDMFLGVPTLKNVNHHRLIAFTGRQLSWDEVITLPHPFA